MGKSILLILTSIFLVVIGQTCLKLGMNQVGRITLDGGVITKAAAKAATSPLIIGGLFLYVVASMIWLVVLSRVDLSVAYPMMSLSYIAVLVIARFALGEDVSPLRWVGVLVIVFGLLLVSRT